MAKLLVLMLVLAILWAPLAGLALAIVGAVTLIG